AVTSQHQSCDPTTQRAQLLLGSKDSESSSLSAVKTTKKNSEEDSNASKEAARLGSAPLGLALLDT
ncbi:hypothetical protein CRENBAI_009963, partial [Crenichthys baileyi]